MIKTETKNPKFNYELSDDFNLEDKEIKIENLPSFIAEVSNSKQTVNDLLDLYRKLIEFNDSIIEDLRNSNIFNRIWSVLFNHTEMNTKRLQSLQTSNDLHKIGLQIFNELCKQLVLQQDQINWLGEQVKFLVSEQNDFRKRLYAKIEDIVKTTQERFRLIEDEIYNLTSDVFENRNRINEIQILLAKHDIRISSLEREVSKIRHHIQIMDWVVTHKNDYDGNRNKFNGSLEVRFNGFFQLADEFLHLSNNLPTFRDIKYFLDVLGYYGYTSDANAKVTAFDLINFISEQYAEKGAKAAWNYWDTALGISRDTYSRMHFATDIPILNPFTSFVERINHLCEIQLGSSKPIERDEIIKELFNINKNNNSKSKMVLNFFERYANAYEDNELKLVLKKNGEHKALLGGLKFNWMNIAFEYISYNQRKKSLKVITRTKGDSNIYLNTQKSLTSIATYFNKELGHLRYIGTIDVKGWKKEFLNSNFELKRNEEVSTISIVARDSDVHYQYKFSFDDLDNPSLELIISGLPKVADPKLSEESVLNTIFGKYKNILAVHTDKSSIYTVKWYNINDSFDLTQNEQNQFANKSAINTEFIEIIWGFFESFLKNESEISKAQDAVRIKLNTLYIHNVKLSDKSRSIKSFESYGNWWKFEINSVDRHIDNLVIWYNKDFGVYETHGAVGTYFLNNFKKLIDMGLGFPTSDEMLLQTFRGDRTLNDRSWINLFQNGYILYDDILKKFKIKIENRGSEFTSDEFDIRYSEFKSSV